MNNVADADADVDAYTSGKKLIAFTGQQSVD